MRGNKQTNASIVIGVAALALALLAGWCSGCDNIDADWDDGLDGIDGTDGQDGNDGQAGPQGAQGEGGMVRTVYTGGARVGRSVDLAEMFRNLFVYRHLWPPGSDRRVWEVAKAAATHCHFWMCAVLVLPVWQA